MNEKPDFTERVINNGIDEQMNHARDEIMNFFSVRKDDLSKYALSNFSSLDLNGDNVLSKDELKTVANDEHSDDKLRAAAALLDVNYDVFGRMCLQKGESDWPTPFATAESQKSYDLFFADDKYPNDVISPDDLNVASNVADPHGLKMDAMTVGTREIELKDIVEKSLEHGRGVDVDSLENLLNPNTHESGVDRLYGAFYKRQLMLEWRMPEIERSKSPRS